MKWIGQHIWDLISRFRNDVYLDSPTAGGSDPDKFLGIDSNNKIIYRTGSQVLSDIGAGSGDITGVTLSGDSGSAADTSGNVDLTIAGGDGVTTSGSSTTLTIATDAAQSHVTSLGTQTRFAVTGASDLGSSLVTLSNTDVDQIALDINADNTTANIINVDGTALTTGVGVFLDTANNRTDIYVDKDITSTSDLNHSGGVYVDIAKAVNTASGQTTDLIGFQSIITDTGTNVGTSNIIGFKNTNNMTNRDGTTSLYGIYNRLTGESDDSVGFYSLVADDTGPDIKLVSSADTGDFCKIETTTHGATTITTVDDNATAAHFEIAADGNIVLDSAAATNIESVGLIKTTGAGVEIENGASSGASALEIDNDDVDQKALHIDAANTTASVINVKATALTTANAIYINCDSLTSGKAIRLDIDDALTTSATKTLVDVDYDKAGTTASGQTSATTGISVNMADSATNHASGAVTMIGAQIDIDSANAQGTITQKGLVLNVAADGTADTATTSGIEMEVVDGGTDIKMMSHANTSDYCTLATTTNGATTITTVDADAASAHFEVAADGDITLDAAGTIKLEGPVRPTGQIQLTHSSFTADIDTTKTYMAFNDGDSENTATNHVDLPLIAPVAGKLLRVTLRANQNLSAKTLTWRLETQAAGVTFSTGPTVVGTQSGAGCTNSSVTTYDFTSSLDSGDNLIDAGDAVFISVQSDASTSNTKFYITCMWEWDFSGI